MKKINLLSIAVSTGSYAEFIDSIMLAASNRTSQYTCVANVHMLIEAHNDHAFGDVVKNAYIITPDGKPLAWALRLLYGIRQDRVAGMDLLPDLLKKAASQQLPVYFYGGSDELLTYTKEHLQKNYSQLNTAGFYSPPFRPLTKQEEDAVIQRINVSGARLVFVVLGCPKQERWMAAMQGRINAVTIGVGGALPVMIGMQQRAPRWMQQAGMEWFFRLAQEPARLFRRYAVTNSTFIYLLFKEYFRTRLIR
jgi:N-acetylglucosaminyldiphosphoundecaprenol N-acetyl-beta-D-mannosaminyltransferase